MSSDLSNNRWFGVRGSISFGSLDTGVMGRLFMMLSTSDIKVTRLSSSVICSRSKACRIFRTVTYTSLPNASEVRSIWRVEGTLDVLL